MRTPTTLTLVGHELGARHRTISLLVAIVLGGTLFVASTVLGDTLQERVDSGSQVSYEGADLVVRSDSSDSTGAGSQGSEGGQDNQESQGSQGAQGSQSSSGTEGLSQEDIDTVAGIDGVAAADGVSRSQAGAVGRWIGHPDRHRVSARRRLPLAEPL